MDSAGVSLSHRVPARTLRTEPGRANSNQGAAAYSKANGSDEHATAGVAVTLLEEDPFSSEASKILFDGMDDLRRCGAAVDLDLPQLVIVGQQSAGKSSLLQSLTDIPFEVGDGLCTRFATRIISRRSAPDTADVVKISIERGNSEPFNGQSQNQKEPFNPHVSSITAEVFKSIFKQASEYMGLTDQRGSKKNNFSSDVLRIELHGPTRSHFGILDVPGIFHTATDTVTEEDMKRVTAMVTSHMKKPENVVICVAPATDNLANQHIFTLAKDHAESSRVVGVFTKCDMAPNPKQIVQIVRDNRQITLQNGWFVVQNRPEDPSPTFDREEEEKATFRKDPWLQIPARQRGITELKKFLANTLSSRIRKAFPEVQRKIKELLATENGYLNSLGNERPVRGLRREYLFKILGKYHELAQDSLIAPERLPSDAMKLRGLTRTAMKDFADNLKLKGHLHDFVEISATENKVEPSVSPLYNEIREQISVNQGEELDGMTNTAVMKPLFVRQTSKWGSFGQEYLDDVVKMSKRVALLILDHISLEFRVPDYTKNELKNAIDEFEAEARSQAIHKLEELCHKNSTFLLATTDENFKSKVKEAQYTRFAAALTRYRLINPPTNFLPASIDKEDPELFSKLANWFTESVIITTSTINQLFEQLHPRAIRNTEDEIHDLLKAYYEVALEYFKAHVIRQIIEEFLQDINGPVLGLSDKYVTRLTKEQVDILGGEDESVVAARSETKNKIKFLEEASNICAETWKKSMQLDK